MHKEINEALIKILLVPIKLHSAFLPFWGIEIYTMLIVKICDLYAGMLMRLQPSPASTHFYFQWHS